MGDTYICWCKCKSPKIGANWGLWWYDKLYFDDYTLLSECVVCNYMSLCQLFHWGHRSILWEAKIEFKKSFTALLCVLLWYGFRNSTLLWLFTKCIGDHKGGRWWLYKLGIFTFVLWSIGCRCAQYRRVKRGNITPPTLEIRFRTSPTLSLYFLKLASSCVGFCQLIHRVVKLLTQIWLLFKRNSIIPPKVRVQNNPHTMDDALTDSMTSVWFAALLKPSGYHLLPFDAPLLSSIVQTPNHHCVRWSQISKMTLLWIYEIQLVVN